MWEQQMFCEWRRWHEEMEPRLLKLELDGNRGSALQQILKAERAAASQRELTATKTQQVKHEILKYETAV